MVISPNIPHWKQLGALWEDWASDDPASDSWNWTADAMQVSMLKKTVARGALAELFSNSPVWWMCDVSAALMCSPLMCDVCAALVCSSRMVRD